MTYEEAVIKRREFLKIDIKHRLHKYNPSKYSLPKRYSASEAVEVAIALNFSWEKMESTFNMDSPFYKKLK